VCASFPWLPRWWWADPAYAYQPPTPPPQDEIAALEDCKKELGEEKASIEKEINDIETQLKELKSKLESEKKQLAGQ
jgi:peptidoglycan hydrolase CwlO-like protein